MKQYVGSTNWFKEHFSINKSDVNPSKVRCGVANTFLMFITLNVYHSVSKFEFCEMLHYSVIKDASLKVYKKHNVTAK